MTYAGLTVQESAETPHLGGSIAVGDPFTFAPKVWNYLINRFSIGSVLDVGSGNGGASHYFFKRGLAVIAVEGLASTADNSAYPAVQHDLTDRPFKTKVDLVHCQEVVEHIEEQYVGNVIETFCCGRVIVMTHAVPGQIGYHHVNLKPSEYWIHMMEQANCRLLEEDTRRIRDFARQDSANFLALTGMVFANDKRL